MRKVSGYKEAMKILKKEKESAGTLRWDGLDGWTSQGYYCPRRGRNVVCAVNKDGMKVF